MASVALPSRPVAQTSSDGVIDAPAAAAVSVATGASSSFDGFTVAHARLYSAYGRQVARNGVKLTRLPPACSPVATRRRTIFGDDLFRPYSQKTSTATTRGAAAKIWRWEVKKGNFSRAFGRR